MIQRLVPVVLCLSWAHAAFAQQRGVIISPGAGAARVDSITVFIRLSCSDRDWQLLMSKPLSICYF